jgi:hypothetical protein
VICPICDTATEDLGGMVSVFFEQDIHEFIWDPHKRRFAEGYRTDLRLRWCPQCGFLFGAKVADVEHSEAVQAETPGEAKP